MTMKDQQQRPGTSGQPEEPSLASRIGHYVGQVYDDLFGSPHPAAVRAPATTLAGTYTGHLKRGGTFTLTLRRVGTQVLGSYVAPSGHRYNVEGRTLGTDGFSVNTKDDAVHVKITGTVQGGALTGQIVNPKHNYSSTYTAQKQPPALKAGTPTAGAAKTGDSKQSPPVQGVRTAGAGTGAAGRAPAVQSGPGGAVQQAVGVSGRPSSPEELKVLAARYPDASFTVKRSASGVATKQERHRVYKVIVAAARDLGEPFPEVLAAQWALESGWGQSPSGKNNLFGIKARKGEPSTQVVTHEQDGAGTAMKVNAAFRDYDSVFEGVRARVNLTRTNASYAKHGYFEATTCREALEALKAAGYATDKAYVDKLVNFMVGMGIDPDRPVQAIADKAVQTADKGAQPGRTATGQTTEVQVRQTQNPAAMREVPAAVPPDLRTLMAKEELTVDEIASARDMIEAVHDMEQRHDLYLALQGKVPYHNQRNNATTREGKRIGDSMCNLTSLAMALETLGIANPEPKHFAQFEDYLEALRVQKKLPARTSMDGWGGVANAMGVSYHIVGGDVHKGQNGRYQRAWWEKNVLPALARGDAATLSIGGHIVRVQEVKEDGLVVDDPYGISRLDAGKGRGWRSTNEKTSATEPETKGAVGADTLWDWEEVSGHTMHWIAILSKQR